MPHRCTFIPDYLRIVISGLVVLLALSCAAVAEEQPNSPPPIETPVEFGWELDAYYSNLNLYVPLTDDKVPNLGTASEFEIYRHLVSRAFVPRFVYFEASVNPMPVLGVYLRKNHPDFYREAVLVGDTNLIEAITAGLREPYAFSIFFGNLADFSRADEEKKGKNRAYSGYLFTVGDQHIRHNVLIADPWLEMEWKIKGDRDFSREKISWSFRIGGRIHQNQEISDTIYLGLRRSNLDFDCAPNASWIKNSSVTLTTEFSSETLKFQRQEITIGKKFPLAEKKIAFSLDFGGIWQIEDRIYSGSLDDPGESDNFIVVLRPNIVF